MNEDMLQESPAQPLRDQAAGSAPALWNPEAAGAWSLIFNPIFGSILVLMNWQAIGDKDKVRNAQIWVAASIFVLVILFFLPSPFLSLGAVTYLLIWYFTSAKPQARYIRERWGKDYPRRSWLWPLLIAFAILFALLCLVFVGGMLTAISSQQ